ncbi:glycosidase [Thermotoga sp. KOL6]|uniref:glycoside hydrolase family 130 protein n=1 Tax=Thermotoga sp. KOL6 TaxID=126741 RepID=UPI000C783966|nr:glycosidase [Thermotoga sp. KOL6]PLV59478.1 glycosidase [Thermotoga sp. KOL6]
MVEEILKKYLSRKRSIRKNETIDIFERITYFFPKDFVVVNYPRQPVAVFNPGAVLVGKALHIFPRVIFDYYKYVSSIGHFVVDIDELMNGDVKRPIEMEIIFWPRDVQEFLGCEDPRVFFRNSRFEILYTAKGYRSWAQEGKPHTDFLAHAILDEELNLLEKRYISVKSTSEIFFPPSMKDSSFVSDNVILTRMTIDDSKVCWRGRIEGNSIDLYSLEAVFFPEDWETKVGWSTNVVETKRGYLIGWHAVLKENLTYKNGLALVDRNGRLLGTTDYILSPKGVIEEYGDRINVIFGCGLVKYEDKIIWIGGVSDWTIGVFATSERTVMNLMKEVT